MKEMGLTGKITPDQVAKKWDNLKTKFKVTNLLHSSAEDYIFVPCYLVLQADFEFWFCFITTF